MLLAVADSSLVFGQYRSQELKLDHVYTTNEDTRWAVAALVRADAFSVTVKAGDDALLGADSVTISGGDLTLGADGDAVTSSKDDDEQKGWIRVTGGMLRAAAGDDALADTTDVLVEGLAGAHRRG